MLVGLVLNMSRLWWRDTATGERAARAARSAEALPFAFYDALAPDEETAVQDQFEGNAARYLAKARRMADAMTRRR